MRFFEIFEDVSPEELRSIEKLLNDKVWMPQSMMKTGGPVLKLVLPKNAHFSQRTAERGESQNITAREIANLLAAAKSDPSNAYYDALQKFAVDDDASHTLNIKDPVSGLKIPVSIEHNRDAFYTKPDSAVAGTRDGKAVPKNVAKAKSIMRSPDISPADTVAHPNAGYNDKKAEKDRAWNRYADLDKEFNPQPAPKKPKGFRA